jgi:hypothetical protein
MDEAAVNIRTTTILLALSLGALACSANTVDLDAPMIEASDEPGVLGVVQERVEKLRVDDERLYWIGTRLPRADQANAWFLHSCQKRDCATTLVTYDAQAHGTQGGGRALSRWLPGKSIGIARYRKNW